MKIRIRKEIFNHILYFVYVKAEWVGGKNSLIEGELGALDSRHYPLFDFDNVKLDNVEAFINSFREYGLNKQIYVLSDKKNHYRVIGTNNISWKNYIYLMQQALNFGLDYQFFRWSIIRGYATIRVTGKKNREEDKVVALYNYEGNEFKFNSNSYIELYQADSDGLKVYLK